MRPSPSHEALSGAAARPPERGAYARGASALHAALNIAAFAILGGVMYLGHRTHWKLPKLSELTGTPAVVADDWCSAHLVPESICIECRDELLPKAAAFGFCRLHGVAECVNCHPERSQAKGPPQLPKYDTVQAISVVDRPENNSRNAMHLSRVQFASADGITKAGIDVDIVREKPMADVVTANGELVFDPARVATLAPRVPGSVTAVFATVGDPVAAGAILAVVDSSQVGRAKSDLLQAVVQLQLRASTVERLRPIANGGGFPLKSFVEAEAALKEAKVALIAARQTLGNLGLDAPEGLEASDPEQLADRLRFLGLPSDVIPAIPGEKTANLVPIRAPFDGVLVDSQVVAGEIVETTSPLFTVADPRRMWLLLSVREEDAAHLRRGLPVAFEPDHGDRLVRGEIAWISPTIDEQTRTLRVRIEITNEDRSLRDHTFGTGRIVLRDEAHAVVVPREAVQSTSDASLVFVRDKAFFEERSPKFFHVRQVRLGARDDGYVEVLAGVLPGEVVATTGSNVLLAQLLRADLGAGCGCHEH